MEKRMITKEDLYQMKFTGSPDLSPDGKHIVYVVTEVSEEKNGYASVLYLSDLSGEPQQLTHPYHKDKLIRDKMPKWSPDGQTIAFLSNRSEKTQIWLLPADGGEAKGLTDAKEDVEEFAWSPDGKQIAYTVKEKNAAKNENEDVTVITRLRYKGNGEGIYDGYTQIWLTDLATNKSAKITSGPYDYHSPSFSPDRRKVIYLAAKNDNEHVELENIYAYDIDQKEETLRYLGKGEISDPKVSPDGKMIAFAGHEEGETSSASPSVWIVPFEGGEARNITPGFDYPVGNYVGVDASYDQSDQLIKWSPDSHSILFPATIGGNCALMHAYIDGTVKEAALYQRSVITSFDEANGILVFVKADPQSTGDLYLHNKNQPTQLSHHNQALFSELKLSEPEGFTYQGADDWEIEGWILPPADIDPNQKVPVILEIHGGPHTAYGNAFHHEFQWLAAQGYAVIYTNPRGSQGYGETFVKACVGDWGHRDRLDILAGLDYALEHYACCDADRLYVTGGSYGGIMTNYMVARTNRFRAAVTQRCISNMYSFFGTSDIGFFFGSSQLGDVDQWEDEDTIMRFSPIREARNVKTPTCIIHSEEDLRCPMEQAEQWYVALKRLGLDTKFIRFKGENHELSRSGKPKNRVRRLQEILRWFDYYEKA